MRSPRSAFRSRSSGGADRSLGADASGWGDRRGSRLLSCRDGRRDAIACMAGRAHHHRRLTFWADDLKLTPATSCMAHSAATPGALDLDLVFGSSHLLLTIEGPEAAAGARWPILNTSPGTAQRGPAQSLDLGECLRPRGGAEGSAIGPASGFRERGGVRPFVDASARDRGDQTADVGPLRSAYVTARMLTLSRSQTVAARVTASSSIVRARRRWSSL